MASARDAVVLPDGDVDDSVSPSHHTLVPNSSAGNSASAVVPGHIERGDGTYLHPFRVDSPEVHNPAGARHEAIVVSDDEGGAVHEIQVLRAIRLGHLPTRPIVITDEHPPNYPGIRHISVPSDGGCGDHGHPHPHANIPDSESLGGPDVLMHFAGEDGESVSHPHPQANIPDSESLGGSDVLMHFAGEDGESVSHPHPQANIPATESLGGSDVHMNIPDEGQSSTSALTALSQLDAMLEEADQSQSAGDIPLYQIPTHSEPRESDPDYADDEFSDSGSSSTGEYSQEDGTDEFDPSGGDPDDNDSDDNDSDDNDPVVPACPYGSAGECLFEYTKPFRQAWIPRFAFIEERRRMEFCFTGIPLLQPGKDVVWWMLQLLERKDKSFGPANKGRNQTQTGSWECQVHVPHRIKPHVSGQASRRGKRVFNTPLLKVMALDTLEKATAFIEEDKNEYTISHLEDITECVDIKHFGLEDRACNLSRKDCFRRAVQQYRRGDGIPRYCTCDRHAHAPCELQSHTEARVFPVSRLIKEIACIRFNADPTSLTQEQISRLRHVVDKDGEVFTWSVLGEDSFKYLVWDRSVPDNVPQRAREYLLPMPDGPSTPVTLKDLRPNGMVRLATRIDQLMDGSLD